MSETQEKSQLENLLEAAQSIQKAFQYAVGSSHGDKPAMFRALNDAMKITVQAVENQVAQQEKITALEKRVNALEGNAPHPGPRG